MRVVCISDTHTLHDRVVLPPGDVLVHAGDSLGHGDTTELAAFAKWWRAQPFQHKVLIAGNHDWAFQRAPNAADIYGLRGAGYLQDQEAVVGGLRVYGSPWQPWFCDWAFNLPRGEKLREVWNKIPDGLDILVTHGPGYGVLDQITPGEHLGCEDLAQAVTAKRPRVHVHGHIHEGYGVTWVGEPSRTLANPGRWILVVNAATCTRQYRPTNPPIVFDLLPNQLPRLVSFCNACLRPLVRDWRGEYVRHEHEEEWTAPLKKTP